MVTKYEYFQKFYELLKNSPLTQQRLYELTEEWHVEKVGKNRYTTFDSFRVAKTYYDNEERHRLRVNNKSNNNA